MTDEQKTESMIFFAAKELAQRRAAREYVASWNKEEIQALRQKIKKGGMKDVAALLKIAEKEVGRRNLKAEKKAAKIARLKWTMKGKPLTHKIFIGLNMFKLSKALKAGEDIFQNEARFWDAATR